jgi:hypothetical protein
MTTQDGGGSQPEERHALAAEVLRIIRRRKNPVRGGLGQYSRTQHLLWRGDSIHVSEPPLPLSVPDCRRAASSTVPRVIVTAQCSQRRPPNNVNHRGRVRTNGRPQRDQTCARKRQSKGMGHETIWNGGRRASRTQSATPLFALPSPRRRREDSARWRAATGGATINSDEDVHGSRRDRRRSQRGGFLFPLAPARPESRRSRGQARPPRPVQVRQPS